MAKETANNGNGWICLHRAMMEWQHYDDVFVKAVFIDLLLSATSRPCWSCGIRLTRGQTLRSSRKIEEDNKISRPTVLKALRTLEESGEIVREKITQKIVKTTIVNYSKYQDFNDFSGKNKTPQRLPQRLPQSLPQTTREQDNNNKERDNKTRTHDEILQEWLNNRITLERFCMAEHLTIDQFTQLAQAVINEWAMTGESGTTESDTRKKMLAHIRRKAQAMNDRGLFIGAEPKDKRLKGIIEDCKMLIAEGYNVDSVREFFAYWTQPANDGTGRMLFEKQSAWDTRTRYIKNLNRKAQ